MKNEVVEQRSAGEGQVTRSMASTMLHPLLVMWLSPRLILWWAVATAAGVAVRLPFARFQIIPHQVDFHPGVVIVPLGAVFLGPAGAWGAAAASLVGDWLLGHWNWAAAFRATGFFFFALGTQRLWESSFLSSGTGVDRQATWMKTLRFLFVTWPGCFTAAVWQAVGSEMFRFYPFSYVVTLLVFNNLLFCILLGLPLYRIMARQWAGRFGSWDNGVSHSEGTANLSLLAMLSLFLAGVAACLAGIYTSILFYNVGIMQPFILGSHAGILVPFVVVPFLILQAIGAFAR